MQEVFASLTIGWMQFLEILLLTLGLFMVLAGIFTAYFGSGKSRTIGVVLLVVGLAVGIASGYWYHLSDSLLSLIWQAFLVAVGIFLVAIMKS